MLDVSAQMVYYYERGTNTPPIDRLEAIARATGKPLAWFFVEQDGSFTPDPARTQEALGELDDLDEQLVAARKTLSRARYILEGLATSIIATRQPDRVEEGPPPDDLAQRRQQRFQELREAERGKLAAATRAGADVPDEATEEVLDVLARVRLELEEGRR